MTERPPLKPRDALLPDRAGPLERAVAKTDGRLDDVSMERIHRVRSVEDAQGAELDHLAAERSVDVYDPLWPEAVRRDVVRLHPLVQAIKGTPVAIETALGAIRVTATVTEWWETSPRGVPWSFTVSALVRGRLYGDGTVLDARTIKSIYASVLKTKAHARPFDLRIGVGFAAAPGLAPVLTGKVRVERAVVPRPATAMAAATGLAPVAVAQTRLTRSMIARLPPEGP